MLAARAWRAAPSDGYVGVSLHVPGVCHRGTPLTAGVRSACQPLLRRPPCQVRLCCCERKRAPARRAAYGSQQQGRRMARQRPGAPLQRATSRPRARAAGTARPARAARTPRARPPRRPPPACRDAAGLFAVTGALPLHAPQHALPHAMHRMHALAPGALQQGQWPCHCAAARCVRRHRSGPAGDPAQSHASHGGAHRPGQSRESRTRCTGSRPAASARAQTVCTFAAPTAAAAAVIKSQRLRSESRSSTWALAGAAQPQAWQPLAWLARAAGKV